MNLTLPIPELTVSYLRRLNARLTETLRDLDRQSAKKTGTTAPTTGLWSQGDFVWNETPSEAGTTLSKYVIIGWSCVASGEPGTWVECRGLTGN